MQDISESKLVNKLSSFYYFNKKLHVYLEYPIKQKKIDIVVKSHRKKSNKHAIEVKIKDWKKGLEQSLKNQIYFPYCSLAISEKYLHRVKKDQFLKEGIGLISIGKNIQKIIQSKRSKFYNKKKKNLLNSFFQYEGK